MDFYLITGFLGAGKTTFLKNFIALFPEKKIYLIINEFGAAGVDGALLSQMNATMAEINNGSIFCACRLDKFEDTLCEAIAQKPDVIIAEASGLADPTNVRRVLGAYPAVSYRGSICLVDSVRLERVFSTAIVCPRQLMVSSLILLNKTDLATAEQMEKTRALVREANPVAQCMETCYGKIETEWLTHLTPVLDLTQVVNKQDITLQKACLSIAQDMPKESLLHCLHALAESTWRMKGFVKIAEGVFLIDCTGTSISVTPWEKEADNRLVLLAGRGMPLRRAMKQTLAWYGAYVTQIKGE